METEDGENKNEYQGLDKKTELPGEASLVGWLGIIFFVALMIFIIYELIK